MINLDIPTVHTIREEFNEYDLDDGNILRAKQILIVFHLSDQIKQDAQGNKMADFQVAFKQVVGAVPSGKVDTSVLLTHDGRHIDKSSFLKKVEFKERISYVNIYETRDFFLFVKNAVTEVWMTKYKDTNNVPIYHVEGNAKLTVKPKSEFS